MPLIAEQIYQAALRAVTPERVIIGNVRRQGGKIVIMDEAFDLSTYERIQIISVGKAAPGMAKALAEILDNDFSDGLVICPVGIEFDTEGMTCLRARHPVPDISSLKAAERALDIAKRAGSHDLVFFCLSGGASSLLSQPVPGISLDEKIEVTKSLLKSGATIRELNTVRKHISAIKGGRLAAAVFPATLINLIISDVVGDDPGIIGSGPTAPDTSTFKEAYDVLNVRKIWPVMPEGVREHILKGIKGEAEETVRPDNSVFKRVRTFIVGNNMLALKAAAGEATRLGFRTRIITDKQEGLARDEAASFMALIEKESRSVNPDERQVCLLAGGELTVEVKGDGLGGRNTEFILSILAGMIEKGAYVSLNRAITEKNERNDLGGLLAGDWLVASIGTDGIDGPTDAAGAWVDQETVEMVRRAGLNPWPYLENNDSYGFFRRTGNLIMTGPTGTNVMDLRLALFRSIF